jgi:hypothetical protein
MRYQEMMTEIEVLKLINKLSDARKEPGCSDARYYELSFAIAKLNEVIYNNPGD